LEPSRHLHQSSILAASNTANTKTTATTTQTSSSTTTTTTPPKTKSGKQPFYDPNFKPKSFASKFRGPPSQYKKPFRDEENVHQPWAPTIDQLPNAPPSFLPYKKPIPTGPNRILAPKSYRRRAISESRAHFMSAEEYARSKFPFPAPIVTKIPLAIRPLETGDVMRMLRKQEIDRVQKEYPSHRDPFVTGDRICVTRYVSLMDRSKVERIYGRVIARKGSKSLTASFTLRNIKLGEPFEITMPLWAPQILRIDLLEKGSSNLHPHVKMYWLRRGEIRDYETHLRTSIPKSATEVREGFSVADLIAKKKALKKTQ
jgi:ribosomal protein L19